MWIADYGEDKLFAYTLDGGSRDADKDIALDANNTDPYGVWSNGTTVWVSDFIDAKLYAYTLNGGARDASRDVSMHSDNHLPISMWSDGTTIWVADFDDDHLYAYTLDGGSRDATKDIDTLDEAGKATARGVWSDGATVWVVDRDDHKVYAYALSNGARQTHLDFDLQQSQGHARPTGIWSDGDTFWVAHDAATDGSPFDRVFSYNQFPDDTLLSLEVAPKDIDSFDPSTLEYMVGVGADVAEATITPTAYRPASSLTVDGTAVPKRQTLTRSACRWGSTRSRSWSPPPMAPPRRPTRCTSGGARPNRAAGRPPTTWTRCAPPGNTEPGYGAVV